MNNPNGLNLKFNIYYDDEYGVQHTFHDIVLRKVTYDNQIMSLGTNITGDFVWIDNKLQFSMREYIIYDDVKYYIVNPPTIVRNGLVKDSSDTKGGAKYSVTFYHPEYWLGEYSFCDVAVNSDEEIYLSQNKKFSWIGHLDDFVDKLNKNLESTLWVCRIDMATVPYSKYHEELSDVLAFDNQYISDVLKTAYETWDVPYTTSILSTTDEDYADGKRYLITFGLPSTEIMGTTNETVSCDTNNGQGIYYYRQPFHLYKGGSLQVQSGATILDANLVNTGLTTYVASEETDVYAAYLGHSADVNCTIVNSYIFKMGKDVGLKNNSATPKNNKIVTRLSGYGSENNVPFGYPQIIWTGDQNAEFTIGNSIGVKENVTINGRTYAKAISYPIYNGIVNGQWVKLIKHPFTRTTLMPSVYHDRVNKKVNPYADGYNPQIEIIDYYDAPSTYPNPVNLNAPNCEIHQFEDIKPRFDSVGVNHEILGAVPYEQKYDNIITLGEFQDIVDALITEDLRKTNSRECADLMMFKTWVMQGSEHDYVRDGAKPVTINTTIMFDDSNFMSGLYISPLFSLSYQVYRQSTMPDVSWDDTMDDDGKYKQSYFKLTLPPLGFDIYACAAIPEEMQINMRSGACIGCTFTVQINWDDYKSVFYDDAGNFVPQGEKRLSRIDDYPDSTNTSITVIVEKDLNTFGTIMPNVYQQPKNGDKFVILGISLPLTYVTSAEQELDEAMMEYMLENNVYHFDYPLNVSEKFLYDRRLDILPQIANNKLFRFKFGDMINALYIKQLSIKYGENPLPEYSITLADDVEITLNQIGQTTEDVSKLRVQMSQIASYYGYNSQEGYASLQNQLDQKLSKVNEDVANEKITFEKGLESNKSIVAGDDILSRNYEGSTNAGQGVGWRIDGGGNAEFESVRVRSYLETNEMHVNRQSASEGDTSFTDNDQILDVESFTQSGITYYRLTLKEKWDGYVTAQVECNVLKGIINTLSAKQAGVSDYSSDSSVEYDGANSYYVSWMLVVDTHETDSNLGVNQIVVSLFDDRETPSGRNFPPCEFMTITRWGNTGDGSLTTAQLREKQRSFIISAKEGRIMKLIDVYQPILQPSNYGTVLGELPDFVKRMPSVAQRIQANPNRDYLYSQGIVVQDFIKIDYAGNPIISYVDKGEWDNTTTYLFESWDNNDKQYETHEVWYDGEKYRALQNSTNKLPNAVGSTYWEKILTKGANGTSVAIKGSLQFAASTLAELNQHLTEPDGSLAVLYYSSDIYRFDAGHSQWNVDSTYSIVMGDGFIYQPTGELVMWNGTIWENCGQIKGDKGDTGDKGDKGDDGDDGRGIASVVVAYALSNQGTTTSSTQSPVIIGSWDGSQPEPTDEHKYLWCRTTTTYTSGIPLTIVRYQLIAVKGTDGQDGNDGKMGRNFYWKGRWENYTEHDKFKVTDFEAPFFSVTDPNTSEITYWVWVGENGTYYCTDENKPQDNEKWEIMVNDFEYLITKAMFTDFARLGDWIFNEDYMYSNQGKTSNGTIVSFDNGFRFYGIGDSNNTYTPNLVMDAHTGEMLANSITLEGVLNNLIQRITSTNLSNFGDYGTIGGQNAFLLNPLKVGTYVKVDLNNGGRFLVHLPTAFSYDGNPYHNTKTGLNSLDEIRQCVGKKIYFMPTERVVESQGEQTVIRTSIALIDANNLLVEKYRYYGNVNDIDNMATNTDYAINDSLRRTNLIDGHGTQKFMVAECKVGKYKGHECIYWECWAEAECLMDE